MSVHKVVYRFDHNQSSSLFVLEFKCACERVGSVFGVLKRVSNVPENSTKVISEKVK